MPVDSVAVGAHGQMQGLGFHWELWSLASGGFTPLEALRLATANGADAIGVGAQLGAVEVGKLADLNVLDRNPLENIRNTVSLKYVMKNGRLYDASVSQRSMAAQTLRRAHVVGNRSGEDGRSTLSVRRVHACFGSQFLSTEIRRRAFR